MMAGHGPWDDQWDGTGRPPGGHYRAADEDRERVISILKTAFIDGRLTKDEYDTRVGQAFAARTYADLGEVTRDLPAPRPPVAARQDAYATLPPRPARPVPTGTNSLARTALLLGFAQFLFGPIGIAAIIVGTKARRQIRHTGEAGYGLATAGVALGWIGVSIMLVVLIAGFGQS
jgi:Domain of unknown function (DUF1707)/Domain of unknown function (DUF4190)